MSRQGRTAEVYTPIEPLMGVESLAATLKVGRRTIERMRAGGKLPRPDMHVGRLPRWKAETIRTWLNDQIGDE